MPPKYGSLVRRPSAPGQGGSAMAGGIASRGMATDQGGGGVQAPMAKALTRGNATRKPVSRATMRGGRR